MWVGQTGKFLFGVLIMEAISSRDPRSGKPGDGQGLCLL